MMLRITQKNCLPLICVIALMLVFFNAPAKCYGAEIDVTPNVLSMKNQGPYVIVHTDITFLDCNLTSATLNYVVDSVYNGIDDLGCFYAKFSMDDIKDLLPEDEVVENIELTLTVNSSCGTVSGSQMIKVVYGDIE